MRSLPLGTSDFPTLRRNDMIYVDKTELIHSLASKRGKFFLARPRRFGKSLLVSTFQSLFAEGLKDFSGLAVEKLWKDKTYKVVRLDFSGLKVFESSQQFERDLRSVLWSAFSPLGFSLTHGEERIGFYDQFEAWLLTLGPDALVLLIDEYDTPLTAHLDDESTFEAIRNHLDRFYTKLKSAERAFRFFFMTGITKVSNTSIFSALNDVADISLDVKYGSLLGLTEEEITRDFDEYLTSAERTLQVDRPQLLHDLKEYYDGFCFDRRSANHVYCPWSIFNFFSKPEEGYLNYWYASGGQPAVLLNYLKKRKLANPFHFDESREIRLSELISAREYKDIRIESLLTQTGYLTIRQVRSNGFAVLGYR